MLLLKSVGNALAALQVSRPDRRRAAPQMRGGDWNVQIETTWLDLTTSSTTLN